jgi:signal transduction histidine kinase
VNELLDISRISAGKLTLEKVSVDLGEIVSLVLDRSAEELKRAGCEVRVDIQGPVRGTWDPMRIEQVVNNLLSNAIKYGEGKPIEIDVWREGTLAHLSVRDHGMGISTEDQRRIFQRFERAVSSRHFGGLGLGLWVARQMVEAHEGTIQVDSAPGRGARFNISLPT